MTHTEENIQFTSLSDERFEEMCFDLLRECRFHSLVWRRGGADSGRDIEALRTIINPLLGPYNERWFIECKRYTNAVPVTELSSKVDWAKAEQPQHLLFFISSYLSNNTRVWLATACQRCGFLYHVIEEKQLKQLVLQYPELASKYFGTEIERLLHEAIHSWQVHGVLPEWGRLKVLVGTIRPERLVANECAFLIASALLSHRTAELNSDERMPELNGIIERAIQTAAPDVPLIPLKSVKSVEWVGFGGIEWIDPDYVYSVDPDGCPREPRSHAYRASLILTDGGANVSAIYFGINHPTCGLEAVLFRESPLRALLSLNQETDILRFKTPDDLMTLT